MEHRLRWSEKQGRSVIPENHLRDGDRVRYTGPGDETRPVVPDDEGTVTIACNANGDAIVTIDGKGTTVWSLEDQQDLEVI